MREGASRPWAHHCPSGDAGSVLWLCSVPRAMNRGRFCSKCVQGHAVPLLGGNMGNMTIIHQINSKPLDRRGPASCGRPGWGFCWGSFLPMLLLPSEPGRWSEHGITMGQSVPSTRSCGTAAQTEARPWCCPAGCQGGL